jgi:ATP-dependent exoDNAse (exonuclease V) beta subunit
VEVCEDFLNLREQCYVCSKPEQLRPPFLKDSKNMHIDANPMRRKGWQFALSAHDDDLNLLYEACTRARAKKILSLPESIQRLLLECDLLRYCVNDFKRASLKLLEKDEGTMLLPRDFSRLSRGEVWALHQD